MRAVFWFGGIVALFALIIGLELAHINTLDTSGGFFSSSTHILTLAGANVRVTIARTPAELERGLSGRSALAPDEGMLFVFEKDGRYAFWMKDMHFSIDIIWLAADSRVVYIAPNVSPDTYPRTFATKAASRFVLEVPAGWAAEHQVHIGDIARLP